MKYVVKDYFLEFLRNFRAKTAVLPIYMALGVLYGNWIKTEKPNWMAGIPIIFAIVSGAFHGVSLPYMMYLVPLSQSEREQYISRMLFVKMLVPVCFALIWDFAALFSAPVSVCVFVLQMVTICIITYGFGTLNDKGFYIMATQAAYGGMRDYAALALAGFVIMGSVMSVICMDVVSFREFLIVLCVEGLMAAPVLNAIRMRWKDIRANFADYEMAVKVEKR